MKILIVIPDHDYGGEERRSYRIFNGLKQLGHQLYFTSESSSFEFSKGDFIVISGLNKTFNVFFSAFHLKQIIKQNDINVVLLFKRKTALIGFLLQPFLPNCKFVFNIANAWQDKKIFWRIVPKYLTTLSWKLVPANLSQSHYIQKINIGSPDVLNSEIIKCNFRNTIRLVSAGKLSFQKNHLYLLEVAKYLQDKTNLAVVVDIAGEGKYRIQLEAKAREYDINLNLRGHVNNMTEFYSEGGIYVQVSNYEGMPNALLEAGLVGLPIVANNVGATGDLITDATGWLVTGLDVNHYVESILDVIGNNDVTNNKVSALKQEIQKNYTEEQMIQGYNTFINKVVR